jgi:hypothetical protein
LAKTFMGKMTLDEAHHLHQRHENSFADPAGCSAQEHYMQPARIKLHAVECTCSPVQTGSGSQQMEVLLPSFNP